MVLPASGDQPAGGIGSDFADQDCSADHQQDPFSPDNHVQLQLLGAQSILGGVRSCHVCHNALSTAQFIRSGQRSKPSSRRATARGALSRGIRFVSVQ
jgi:hypothetical protein